jgi:N-acetylglucosamine malate deacetylase 1
MTTNVHSLITQYQNIWGVNVPASSNVLTPLNKSILIIAPHPDDETLNATLALRLRLQHQCKIYVLPFSFGSNTKRQSERLNELKLACKHLGFFLLPSEHLNEINISEMELALIKTNPDLVIFPHNQDHHSTHIRCSQMAHELCTKHQLKFVTTEYWQPQLKPNLAIETSLTELRLMLEALVMHEKEIERNPYHISFPARLMDQYRRASEVIQGHTHQIKTGLCEIYQAPHLERSQFIACSESLALLF